jgi:AP endonuclease-2
LNSISSELNLSVSLDNLDKEGRVVATDHGEFILFNVYVPNAASGIRLFAQIRYLCALERISRELVQRGRQIVIVGDLNCAHCEIDHCDPKRSIADHRELVVDWSKNSVERNELSEFEKYALGWMDRSVGILKEKGDLIEFSEFPARLWMSHILKGSNDGFFIDCFRKFHPNDEGAFTCWNTRINAREGNYGTRIDYILASEGLLDRLSSCNHLPGVKGSDHCPVVGSFLIQPQLCEEHPALCSTWIVNELKKQKKLSSFFRPIDKSLVKPETSSSTTISKPSKEKSEPLKKGLERFGFTKAQRNASKQVPEDDSVTDEIILIEPPKTVVLNSDTKSSESWKSILHGNSKIPKCYHNEDCLSRTVTKKGANQGRKFYVCKYPTHVHHTAATTKDQEDESSPIPRISCNYFQWSSNK